MKYQIQNNINGKENKYANMAVFGFKRMNFVVHFAKTKYCTVVNIFRKTVIKEDDSTETRKYFTAKNLNENLLNQSKGSQITIITILLFY